jgi:hypothetical protein
VLSDGSSGGGTHELAGNITMAEPLRLDGGRGSNNEGALSSVSGNNTWSGPITLLTTTSFQTISASFGSVLTISGTISQEGGTASLQPSGNGTLKLTAANTYTGSTSVSMTLVVANTSGSATGTWRVEVSGTFAGTGIIAGQLDTFSSASVAPGDSTLGANQRGNLRLDGGLRMVQGTYRWDLGALSTTNPGVDFDRLTVGGTLTLGGTSLLTLDFGALGASGPNSADPFWLAEHTWVIVDFTGIGPASDTFRTITNPTYTSGTFSLLNPALFGGDIVLQTTPVPESTTALGLAAIGLWAARRARRHGPGSRPTMPSAAAR